MEDCIEQGKLQIVIETLIDTESYLDSHNIKCLPTPTIETIEDLNTVVSNYHKLEE